MTPSVLAPAVEVLSDMSERRGALGALPARHTLRPPRRAGGVEQQRQILGPGLRREAARGAGQFLEPARAAFGPADRDARQSARRNRAADRGSGHLVEHEGGQPARHAADLTVPRRVAQPPLPVDDRQRVGTALDHGKKGAAQIKHGPDSTNIGRLGLRGGRSEALSGEVLPYYH
jgi:hypothetical protein